MQIQETGPLEGEEEGEGRQRGGEEEEKERGAPSAV